MLVSCQWSAEAPFLMFDLHAAVAVDIGRTDVEVIPKNVTQI